MDIDINGEKHASAVEIMHKLQAENIAESIAESIAENDVKISKNIAENIPENTLENDVKISENTPENIAENIAENTVENDHDDQIYHEKFSRISYLCACSIL